VKEMIKEHVYEEMADEFGTSVGVAHIIGYKTKKETIQEEGIEIYKETKDDLVINGIICDAIELELYQELQKEIFKIKQKGNKRLKSTTIYRRAFNELSKDENYITKSGQIF
jgi:hypothetical protein